MIFRKPYAILIKYFKLIHVVLTVMMAYLLYRTYNLYNFLTEYMKTTMLKLGRGATDTMFNSYMFILPLLIVVFAMVMLITMIRKNKPRLIYIADVICFSSLLGIYIYLNSQFIYLEDNIMSARTVKLMQDFSLIMMLSQFALLLPTLIRAIGFDIKKFDFKKDLLEMDIDDADNEEFEVSFNFEGNVVKREINKKIRNIKYAYLENKFLFKVLALGVILFVIYSIFTGSSTNNTILKMNEGFSSDGVNLEVTDAFMTQKDYKIKKITSSEYILVEINAKGVNANTKLNTARMQLIINNTVFYPVEDFNIDVFSDIGSVYVDDYLDVKNYNKYLFVYEIPENLKHAKKNFRYISVYDENDASYISVSLKVKEIDNEDKSKDVSLKKDLVLNKDILGNSSLKIDSFEIKNDFVSRYKYCPLTGECYSSKEYIRPNLNSTLDKALLKINATFTRDKDIQVPGISNAFSLINKFGTIVYKYNGKTYKMRGELVNINPKKNKVPNVYYVEVNQRMVNCDYAYLLLKIRNKEYKYVIKNI